MEGFLEEVIPEPHSFPGPVTLCPVLSYPQLFSHAALELFRGMPSPARLTPSTRCVNVATAFPGLGPS